MDIRGRLRDKTALPLMPQCAAHRLSLRQFLDGPPVCTLDGKQFLRSDTPLAERVAQWYKANGFATVHVPQIGEVVLDKKAVSRSINHGLSREKAAAFAAIPDVLLGGRIIHTEAMEGSTTGGQVYHVAAPVRIAGKDFVASSLLKADENINRLYVHEVFLKEKLHAPDVSAVAADTTGKRADKGNGVIAKVLRDLYAVNSTGHRG